MKILSIVGARPQFIKCAPLSRELRKEHTEILVHTGQHYDPEMSEVFFSELEIPRRITISGSVPAVTGSRPARCLLKLKKYLVKEKPELVIVYGDTNSTLAGALAAAKLRIPVAHVEAGLRSFDRTMPEEINRVVTDHISDLLFCPTEISVKNLANEGITKGVHLVGDVMADALAFNQGLAQKKSRILERLGVKENGYCVLTIHRAGNTNNQKNLSNIIQAIGEAGVPVVFPVHPRTRKYLNDYGLFAHMPENIHQIEPLGHLDMIRLMGDAKKIITDSGGMQKEAYILGVPCITLRENTEWIETLEDGWNVTVGTEIASIESSILSDSPTKPRLDLYPLGASQRIREIVCIM